MNGGRKEDFEDLTAFDMQLIRITHDADKIAQAEMLAEIIARMFGKEENG